MKIKSVAFGFLMYVILKTAFLGSGMSYIFSTSLTSSVFCIIVGFLISFIFLFLIYKLINILPEYSIIEKINILFKGPSKIFINVSLFIISLLSAIFAFSSICNFVTIEFLDNTPKILICLLLFITIFYLSQKDVEVLSRFALIGGSICFISFVLNNLSLLSYIDISNLKPYLSEQPIDLIKATITFAILFSGPMFFLTMIPRKCIVEDNKKFRKNMIFFFSLSGGELIIIFFTVLCVLGIDITRLYNYSVFVVLRNINVLNFLENVEDVAAVRWFIYLTISVTLSIMFAKEEINICYKVKNKKLLSYLICGGVFIVSFILINFNYNFDVGSYVIVPLLLFSYLILITFIVLIKYYFYKNKKTFCDTNNNL
ncbi:MAG: GerAB/ArcD/ProY family transporter [Bacilli bacterium]